MFKVSPVVQLGGTATIVLIICISLLIVVFLLLLAFVKNFPQRLSQVLRALKPFFPPSQKRRNPARGARSRKGGQHD